MSLVAGAGTGFPVPSPGTGANVSGSRGWLPVAGSWDPVWGPAPPWAPCGTWPRDGTSGPVGARGIWLDSAPEPWLRGTREPEPGAEAPESCGTAVTGERRSAGPVGALPSGSPDGMTPEPSFAAEHEAPALGGSTFFPCAPLSLLAFLDFFLGALGPGSEGPGARGSGMASRRPWSFARRACNQESISCHCSGPKPMQRSQGSALLQERQMGHKTWGSQPLPGRNWEHIAQRAVFGTSMTPKTRKKYPTIM